MKAILLAAGRGARLGNITEDTPKPMLKVNGEVILEHNLKWLKKSGIEDIFINLHHRGNVIKKYFGAGEGLGVRIAYSSEEELLGTAGGVKKILKDFPDEVWDDFLVVYADNYYPQSFDLDNFMAFHIEKKGFVSMGLYKKDAEMAKAGVVILGDNSEINEFIEKPDEAQSKKLLERKPLINAGIYLLNKGIADYIGPQECDFGKNVFPVLLRNARHEIFGYVFPPDLVAIDNPELYNKARELNS